MSSLGFVLRSAVLEHVQFLWRTRDGLFQLRPEAQLAEDDDRP